MTAAVALAHDIAGPPDGPPLLLAHAIGMTREMWAPQVDRLAREWRVIVPDLRGHGDSPVPTGPYRIEDHARDLLLLLDRLAIWRASLCGLSMGGMAALLTAALAPERVDRVVAMAVVAKPESPSAWIERAAAVRGGGTAAITELVASRWGYLDRAPAIRAFVEGQLRDTPDEGYAACCEAIAAMDLGPALPRVAAPTLVLTGAVDPAAPPGAAAGIVQSIPGARCVVVDDAAHLVSMEQPEAVNDAIMEHLRG